MLREGMLAAALRGTTAMSISTEAAALATEAATPASAAEALILV
jgi:hypothetical protein